MKNRTIDIIDDGIIYAQIYDLNIDGEVIFPTKDFFEMQCGFGTIMNKTKKNPHIHKLIKRETRHTSEFFFIYQGEVVVTFYNINQTVISKKNLTSGMGFIQFQGGHGFSFAPNTKYIEVKQGPYMGNTNDKYFFNS